MKKVTPTKDLNMLFDKGKIYFEADTLSEWLQDAKHPVIRTLGKGLKLHADEMKNRALKQRAGVVHES